MEKYIEISDKSRSASQYFRLLHQHRKLIYSLLIRNIRQTYAGSRLGILSSLFQPIISLVFFSVFFGLLIKLNTGNVGYLYYAFSGIIIWNFFSMSFSDTLTSLSKYSNVISKLYFPRMVVPISSLGNAILIAFISFLLLLVIMFSGGYAFRFSMLLFPFFLILTLICSMPIAMWLSLETLKKRDLLFIIPGIIGFGSWLTPVFYPVTLIPEPYTSLIYLNPLTDIVMLFRWSLFGTSLPEMGYFFILLVPVFFAIICTLYFIKKDGIIADYI